MLLRIVLHAGWAVALLSLVACSGSHGTGDAAPASEAGPGPGPGDGGTPPIKDAAADQAVVDPAEATTPQLPRTPADPKLTRRLVPGGAALVGGDNSSCSRPTTGGAPTGTPTAPGTATTDRWCAFSLPKPAPDGGAAPGAELWVLNVTRAIAGEATPCDGTSPSCLRLSTTLWTGMPIWGPSHPYSHRFSNDVLIFHAGQAAGQRQPYEGGVWAWRPGWAAARQLTSDKGVLCEVHHGRPVVYCVDNALVDKDPTVGFDRPRMREFDLLAGELTVATGPALAKVARLTNAGGEFAWRARLSPDGEQLAFSSMAAEGAPETVQVIKVADAGKTAPALLLAGAAEWEFAHDGAKLYFLKGYDRKLGEDAAGTLAIADFPGGGNVAELTASVLAFELLGARDQAPSPIDRGALLAQSTRSGRPKFLVLRDRSRPEDLLDLGSEPQSPQVATDARHTLYAKRVPDAQFPVAFVARNDGSGSCQLTSDIRAETYGGFFTESARSVFWIEYGRNGSESEEGWYARPESCSDKTKYGDFVLSYRVIGDEFVVFDGGDLADTTSWLQYTPLTVPPGPQAPTPTVIKEHPDSVVDFVRSGNDTFVVFSVSQGEPGDLGLHVHGPLRR